MAEEGGARKQKPLTFAGKFSHKVRYQYRYGAQLY